jgi:predicted ATPase
MLTTLTVSNYRSLGENVSIAFGGFTVLVGPNGAGKSNVMDALRFVADAMHMGLSGALSTRQGIGAVRRWSGELAALGAGDSLRQRASAQGYREGDRPCPGKGRCRGAPHLAR